jgi:hypothetical protein
MTSAFILQLRNFLSGSNKPKDKNVQPARDALQQLAAEQKEFEFKKKKVDDDIRRGARQSRGKLPD